MTELALTCLRRLRHVSNHLNSGLALSYVRCDFVSRLVTTFLSENPRGKKEVPSELSPTRVCRPPNRRTAEQSCFPFAAELPTVRFSLLVTHWNIWWKIIVRGIKPRHKTSLPSCIWAIQGLSIWPLVGNRFHGILPININLVPKSRKARSWEREKK
jgi:hypothetical protein